MDILTLQPNHLKNNTSRTSVGRSSSHLTIDMLSVVTRLHMVYPMTYYRLLPRLYLPSKSHAVFRCRHTCTFIYFLKKMTVFPAPFFTKLADTQQHHVQILYSRLYASRVIDVESVDSTLCAPLIKVYSSLENIRVLRLVKHTDTHAILCVTYKLFITVVRLTLNLERVGKYMSNSSVTF
jgi:hypothetical protein